MFQTERAPRIQLLADVQLSAKIRLLTTHFEFGLCGQGMVALAHLRHSATTPWLLRFQPQPASGTVAFPCRDATPDGRHTISPFLPRRSPSTPLVDGLPPKI